MNIIIHNESELQDFATTFAQTLKGGEVIGLVGDLGAGKTTFTKYLGQALGAKRAIKSPTFIVLQIFDVGTPLRQGSSTPRLRLEEVFDSEAQTRGGLRLRGSDSRRLGGFVITKLVHIDAYRLKSYTELIATGFLDYAGQNNIITIVEWPDLVPEIRKLTNYRELNFKISGEQTRVIYEGHLRRR